VPPVETADVYPDLEALFAQDFGIFRTCGPNGGVCHNSRQYPDLHSTESVASHVGRPCNELRDRPEELHDWCERQGDFLRIGEAASEIGWLEPLDDFGRVWRIHLRGAPPLDSLEEVQIARRIGSEWRPLYPELEVWAKLELAGTSFAPAVDIELLPFEDPPDARYVDALAEAFATAGVPGDPASIQLGDPNRNGIFGADLENALILPGAPERSYLIRRLTDPSFGTLMPLANCCFWTKESLRALWCWIAGLDRDGSNAFAPIDYESCPDGPNEDVIYPEVGPDCEIAGPCPVRPGETMEPDASFTAVFSIIQQNCAGSSCHVGGNAAGFSIPAADVVGAYDAVLTRVVPGDSAASELFRRIRPELCMLPECILMPFARTPLLEEEQAIIRDWIDAGAPRS
jgi:hypothetical protein